VRMLAAAVGIRITEPGLPWWTTKFVFLIRPIGAWVLKRENPKLAHLWGKFIAESGLSAAITPRIDIEWLDYVLDDHGFDNTALERLGFTLNHPTITEGMRTTLQWYRERGWLPPGPAKALLSSGSDTPATDPGAEAQDPAVVADAAPEPPSGNSPPPSAPPA